MLPYMHLHEHFPTVVLPNYIVTYQRSRVSSDPCHLQPAHGSNKLHLDTGEKTTFAGYALGYGKKVTAICFTGAFPPPQN